MNDWRDEAMCARVGSELWFPSRGNDGHVAKRICLEACPVQAECLADALTRDEEYGIFGGLGPRQRRELRRATA